MPAWTAQAGSACPDIVTRAVPDGTRTPQIRSGPRYRLRSNKMWISNGEHELAETSAPGAGQDPGPDGKLVPGTRGISLFIVPKKLVDSRRAGSPASATTWRWPGLNHKLGWRGIPNTLLNFGEGKYPVRGGARAIGAVVGKPGEGLRCMFHMMNEARIAGPGAPRCWAMPATRPASTTRATARRAARWGPGRIPQPQIPIIRHADVRRMLGAEELVRGRAGAGAVLARATVDELAYRRA